MIVSPDPYSPILQRLGDYRGCGRSESVFFRVSAGNDGEFQHGLCTSVAKNKKRKKRKKEKGRKRGGGRKNDVQKHSGALK